MKLLATPRFFILRGLVLYGFIVPGIVHGMLYQPSPTVEKVVKKNIAVTSGQFVSAMPYLSVIQIGDTFAECSALQKQGIRSLLVEKDCKNDNRVFSATFYMATKLSLDMQKQVVPFGHDKEAMEKFLHMPVGKALEWWAFVDRVSCGRVTIAHLPIFDRLFNKNCHTTLCYHQDEVDNFLNTYCDGKYKLTATQKSNYLYYAINKWTYSIRENDLTIMSITVLNIAGAKDAGDVIEISWVDLKTFFDQIPKQLFKMSIKELCALIGMKKDMRVQDLPYLVSLDKKMSFLAHKGGDTSIKYYRDCSTFDFLKNSAKISAAIFVPLALPILSFAPALVGVPLVPSNDVGLPFVDSWASFPFIISSFFWAAPFSGGNVFIFSLLGWPLSTVIHRSIGDYLGTDITKYVCSLGSVGMLSCGLGAFFAYINGSNRIYEKVKCKDIVTLFGEKTSS